MNTLPERSKARAPDWHKSNGTYIAGQAAIDEADKLAVRMEEKWGAGRLRLLVSIDLREKFDRQRYLLNKAMWHGDLEQVRREAGRMCSAWRALDKAAAEAGAEQLDPNVWEISLSNGDVVAIVPSAEHERVIRADGRKLQVFTLEEIGRLIEGFPEVVKAKAIFPGATVTSARRSIGDPLDAIADTARGLDDELSDEIPF